MNQRTDLRAARANGQRWKNSTGQMLIWRPTAEIVVYEYQGHFDAEVVDFIREVTDRVIAEGVKPDIWVDARGLDGYKPAYRQAIQKWVGEVRPNVGVMHIVAKAKIVSMAISVVVLALGVGPWLKNYPSPLAFDAALDAAIRAAGKTGQGTPRKVT